MLKIECLLIELYDLKKLEIKYNIVLRPHPKYKDLNRPNYNLIKKSKLKLDLLDGRNTADLIKISDYIIQMVEVPF